MRLSHAHLTEGVNGVADKLEETYMNVKELINIIGADFYTGVPDSQLKALCNYLINTYGIDKKHHIIAANEGNCAAIASGYYLATEKIPVIYMQNSGQGNIINPVASLLNDKVYAIPAIFIVDPDAPIFMVLIPFVAL